MSDRKEKFTPGPWMAFYKSKYNEWHVSVPGQDETGMRLALFPDGVLTRHPEGDAHLIAAAPEMYEALQAMKSAMLDVLDVSDLPDDILTAADDAMDKANAARKKARGEA